MATVGQALINPELGWKRYSDNDKRLGYTGNWTNYGSFPNYIDNYLHATTDPSAKLTFKFYGSKLRIIGSVTTTTSSACNIKIDGNLYTYSMQYGYNQDKTLIFTKEDLDRSIHTVEITPNINITSSSNTLNIDAVDIDDSGDLLGTGVQLPIPESGWQRYDASHNKLNYIGTWNDVSNSSFYGGFERRTTVLNDCMRFRFKGTKLRIISNLYSTFSNNIEVKIDGQTYNYSLYSSSDIYPGIAFEIVNLSLSTHTVSITNKNNGKILGIDAIDIGTDGNLEYYQLYLIQQGSDIYSVDDLGCYKIGKMPATEEQFLKYGVPKPDYITTTHNTNNIIGTFKGTLGSGKYFEVPFNTDYKSILGIEMD